MFNQSCASFCRNEFLYVSSAVRAFKGQFCANAGVFSRACLLLPPPRGINSLGTLKRQGTFGSINNFSFSSALTVPVESLGTLKRQGTFGSIASFSFSSALTVSIECVMLHRRQVTLSLFPIFFFFQAL